MVGCNGGETRDAADEVKQYRKGKVTSCSEAMWRLLGFNMFVSEPPVKDATVHDIVPPVPGSVGTGASEFTKYVFRPQEIDNACGEVPLTVVDFFEAVEVVVSPPACVKAALREAGHNEEKVEAITVEQWAVMRLQDGRRVFHSCFPQYGAKHAFYYKRATGRVFRLTRERVGTEAWYRRLLCMHVSVTPQVDNGHDAIVDPLKSLRVVHGVEYATYYEAACARDLVSEEQNAEVAIAEAIENGDVPYVLTTLLCTLIVADYQCNRILTDESVKYVEMRDAMTADVDVGSVEDRRQELLERVQEVLKSNNRNLSDYNLPSPDNDKHGTKLEQERRFWQKRSSAMFARAKQVSVTIVC